MATVPTAMQRFQALDEKVDVREYNYDHFRPRHLVRDVRRTLRESGVRPGQAAPDFELPRAEGGSLRLSDLRGDPVLLHFGSIS